MYQLTHNNNLIVDNVTFEQAQKIKQSCIKIDLTLSNHDTSNEYIISLQGI